MTVTIREIAEKLGFAGPESVRNWLRHARRLGLIEPVGRKANGNGEPQWLYEWPDIVRARRRCREIGIERRKAGIRGNMSGPPSAEVVARLLVVMEQVCRGETWPSDRDGGPERGAERARRWRRFRRSVA